LDVSDASEDTWDSAATTTFALLDAINTPAVKEKLAGLGAEVATGEQTTPAYLGKLGTDTGGAASSKGRECTLGEVMLTAAGVATSGVPAAGQVMTISDNTALFSLIGTSYGGDGKETFRLPDYRSVAVGGTERVGGNAFSPIVAAFALGVGETLFDTAAQSILPSIVAGWMLAFTLSLDDLVIASFTCSSRCFITSREGPPNPILLLPLRPAGST
jgi:hypothetical protein